MKREWKKIKDYKEILFDFYEGIARITINREHDNGGDERRALLLS